MTEHIKNRYKITLFSCTNTGLDEDRLTQNNCELHHLKLACSSMIKDVFLLRALESGADAVIIVVCPKGTCRHIEGNIRAEKRVLWVKNLLDETGIDGKRLTIHQIPRGDHAEADRIILNTLSDLVELGPNPGVSLPSKSVG